MEASIRLEIAETTKGARTATSKDAAKATGTRRPPSPATTSANAAAAAMTSSASLEGRTKRCLYLFASCSVDAPYSWTYLKSRFIAMEPTISAMEAARTN